MTRAGPSPRSHAVTRSKSGSMGPTNADGSRSARIRSSTSGRSRSSSSPRAPPSSNATGHSTSSDPIARYVPGLPAWGDGSRSDTSSTTRAACGSGSATGPGRPVDGVPAWGNADRARRAPPGRRAGLRAGHSRTATRIAATCCSPRSSPRRAARPSPPSRVTASSSRSAWRDSFFRDDETPLPERAARGHFEAERRCRLRGAGEVPRGRRGRALDDRRRPRALERRTSTTTGSPTAGSPSGSRPAARSTTAPPIHYAWGLSVRTHRGLPIVSHGGNFPGWESKMVRFPTERTTVIVLANREDLDVSAIAFASPTRPLPARTRPRCAPRRRDVRRRSGSGAVAL